MPDSSTVDLSANWNMAPRGGSLPRADHRIPCISYLFLKTLASKKGQMWTEGRHSVFFPPRLSATISQLLSPTSQISQLPSFICILGRRALGVENLVSVLPRPTLLLFLILEDSGRQKFAIVNVGLQGMKSCCENCRGLHTTALTMAFV